MIQDELRIQNTQCDNCIIGTMVGHKPRAVLPHHGHARDFMRRMWCARLGNSSQGLCTRAATQGQLD
jgi:hypothetical protein